MILAPFKVVADANVLFPAALRDTMLRAAAADLYQLYWSETILDEVERNLVSNAICSGAQAEKLRRQMMQVFPESLVAGFDELIEAMPNQEKDRHVAAAAVKCGAELVVTSNLKDFRSLPDGLEAKGPDVFLCDLFDLEPYIMAGLICEQKNDLRNPPLTWSVFLKSVAVVTPEFSRVVGDYLAV